MFFRLAHLQIEQDIALQYSHDHSNIRGTTSNAESIPFGPTQRHDTTSNIMNPDAKASGGESSVINRLFSVMEPEEDGGAPDIHECQHLEVVARGNSCTEDTDLVEPAGEEPGASSSKRAQKTALVTNPKVQRGVRKIVAKRTCSSRSAMNPPGPSWKPKLVKYRGQNRYHWISPSRCIEFTRHTAACQFEKLREKTGNDEGRAWSEYRRTAMKRGLPALVVSPEQYDVETHINRATKEIALSERGKQHTRNPLPRSGQTTGHFRKPMVVDQKWASSLVGLRLKVPAHWWNNCSGNTLYAGQIADINFSDDAKRYFMLKLDSEENRNLHTMRYDAVLRYADKEHPTHSRFDLPEKPPAPADPNVTKSGKRKCREELVQAVPKAKKLQKTIHEAAKKLPIDCIKSKGKNTPVVKSTKNRCDSPARKLYHKDSTPSYLWVSPFKSSARPTLNDGLNCSNIKITRLKETKKTSFFEDKFKGRILLVESSLNHETVPEKTVTYVSEHG